MALTARLQKVSTATTTASGSTAKVTATVTGLIDAVIDEVVKCGTLTPNQQSHLASMRANAVANIATLQTALGL